jgi:hypothetical protein
MPSKLKQLFRETWTLMSKPQGLLFLAFTLVANLIITGFVNEYFDGRRATQERVEKAVEAFRAEAERFDALVLRYTTALVEHNKVSPEARLNLMENLIRQRQLLEQAARLVPGDLRQQTTSYEEAIDALNREIPKADSVLTMRDFWLRANQLALARVDLWRRLGALGV